MKIGAKFRHLQMYPVFIDEMHVLNRIRPCIQPGPTRTFITLLILKI